MIYLDYQKKNSVETPIPTISDVTSDPRYVNAPSSVKKQYLNLYGAKVKDYLISSGIEEDSEELDRTLQENLDVYTPQRESSSPISLGDGFSQEIVNERGSRSASFLELIPNENQEEEGEEASRLSSRLSIPLTKKADEELARLNEELTEINEYIKPVEIDPNESRFNGGSQLRSFNVTQKQSRKKEIESEIKNINDYGQRYVDQKEVLTYLADNKEQALELGIDNNYLGQLGISTSTSIIDAAAGAAKILRLEDTSEKLSDSSSDIRENFKGLEGARLRGENASSDTRRFFNNVTSGVVNAVPDLAFMAATAPVGGALAGSAARLTRLGANSVKAVNKTKAIGASVAASTQPSLRGAIQQMNEAKDQADSFRESGDIEKAEQIEEDLDRVFYSSLGVNMAGNALGFAGIISGRFTGARRLSTTTKEKATNFFKNSFKGFNAEGATEALQEVGLNKLAKEFYDENRELFKGLLEAYAVGGIIGSFAKGFGELYGDVKVENAFDKLSKNLADQIAKNLEAKGELDSSTGEAISEAELEGVQNSVDFSNDRQERKFINTTEAGDVVEGESTNENDLPVRDVVISNGSEFVKDEKGDYISVEDFLAIEENLAQESGIKRSTVLRLVKSSESDQSTASNPFGKKDPDLNVTSNKITLDDAKGIFEGLETETETDLGSTTESTFTNESPVGLADVEGLTVDENERAIRGNANDTPMYKRILKSLFRDNNDSPVAFREAIEEAQRVEEGLNKMVTNTAKLLEREINAHVKAEGLDAKEFNAIIKKAITTKGGLDADLIKELPESLHRAMKVGRDLVDSLTKEIISLDLVGENLQAVFEERIGSYLTRSYQAFDRDAKWSYETMPDATRNGMLQLIKKTHEGISNSDAELLARELLDVDTGPALLLGLGQSKRTNTNSFKKRNDDLDPRYRKFLGEIDSPVANIAITGKNLSQILGTFKLQKSIADIGVRTGLFSTEKTGKYQHEVFPDKVNIIRDEKGEILNANRTKDKSVAGLNTPTIYTTKAMARQTRGLFSSSSTNLNEATQVFTKAFNTAVVNLSSTTKIVQVLFNDAIYMPALFGGHSAEIAQGRVNPKHIARGAKIASRDFRSKKKIEPFDVAQRRKLGETKVSDLSVSDLSDTELEVLGTEQGIGSSNLILQDLIKSGTKANIALVKDLRNRLFDRSGKNISPQMIKDSISKLGQFYALGDTAAKYSAFLHELNIAKRAFPDMTLDEAVSWAGERVRATTPTYSQIPKILRNASIYGFGINFYLGFTWEIFRNTTNGFLIGAKDLTSKNAVIRASGAKRLAAVLGTLAFTEDENLQTMLNLMGKGADKDEVEIFKEFDTPDFWDANAKVYSYDRDTKSLVIHMTSYTAPTAEVSSFLGSVFRKDDDVTHLQAVLKGLAGKLSGDHPSLKAIREASNGIDQYGNPIWSTNDRIDNNLDRLRKSLSYVVKRSLTAGAYKSYEQWGKAQNNELDEFGRQFSTENFLSNRLLPYRSYPYKVDAMIKKQSGRMNFIYKSLDNELESELTRQKDAKVKDTKKIEKLETQLQENKEFYKDRYKRYILSRLDLGISKRDLLKQLQNSSGEYSNIPTDLRVTAMFILPELKPSKAVLKKRQKRGETFRAGE